jgi:hypothetical protein
MKRPTTYEPGQRVVWVGDDLHEAGPDGRTIRIASGDVATVVLDDWPTDFVVNFAQITLCCHPSDVRALEDGTR